LKQVPVISIVDDDRSVRAALKRLIGALGYTAETYVSAEEFLNSAQLTTTDCLITDIQMPGLSGIELRDQLTAEGRDIPVVFITAYPEQRIERRALQNGAIGYLSKPIRESSLIDCIEEALRQRKN
jgi:FixJ family two-component response regulator